MIQGLNSYDAPVGNMDVRVSIDAVASSSGISELLGLLARAPHVALGVYGFLSAVDYNII